MKNTPVLLFASLCLLGCGQDQSTGSEKQDVSFETDSSLSTDSMSKETMEKMLKLKYHTVYWKLQEGFSFESLHINDIPQFYPEREGFDPEVFFTSDSIDFSAVIKGPKSTKCSLSLRLDKNAVLLPQKALNLMTDKDGVAQINFKFR